MAIIALIMLALSFIAVSPVQAAVLKNGPTDSGPSNSGTGAACFVSTIATVDASFFISDWPISSLLGFLALIGLLWLGKRKKVSGWEGEKVRRKKAWPSALSAYRIGRKIIISFRARLTSRFSEEKAELGDPGDLAEVRLRIEERPDGITPHPCLPRDSKKDQFPLV